MGEEHPRTSLVRTVCRGAHVGFNALSLFFLSLTLVLAVPLLPIMIEWVKDGSVTSLTYLITAAVLAAALAIQAEHNFCRAMYFLTFLVTIVLYSLTVGADHAPPVDRFAGILLLSVIVLHSSERFYWHVVLHRSIFPVKEASGNGH